MAEEYKICLAGPSTAPVAGTENLTTMEQIEEWLHDNQVYYAADDPQKPVDGGSKYIVLPKDM